MEILSIAVISIITFIAVVSSWVFFSGTFIMTILALVMAWWGGFQGEIQIIHIILLFALSAILEVIEFGLGAVVAQQYGASKRSTILSIVGGIVGTILGGSVFIFIGALIGLLTGAYLGAYWGERQDGKSQNEAKRAALAVLAGTITSKVLKSVAVVWIGFWLIQVAG